MKYGALRFSHTTLSFSFTTIRSKSDQNFSFTTIRSKLISFSFTTIRSKLVSMVLRLILISLNLDSLSWNLFAAALLARESTADWMLDVADLGTVSEIVLSTTYFHSSVLVMSRSFIITMKSQDQILSPEEFQLRPRPILKSSPGPTWHAVSYITGNQ